MSITEDISIFRRFNRMYTRFIGTLREGWLNTEYSLAEVRVLYELANRRASNASALCGDLGLDPGYASRMLTKFESTGLVKRKASAQDSRSSALTLTARGKAVFTKLNTLSDAQARTILEAFPHPRRTQVIRSMQVIESVLNNDRAKQPPYILRPHRAGDMGWVVARESAVYAEEYSFDQTFEALVARIVADFLTNFDASRERCWIAEVDGESMGHIFLMKHPDRRHTAKLRLLFVEPGARGIGLGQVLVEECIRFARSAGYRKIILWTQSILLAAHSIYRKAGFQLVKEEPHHSFGHHLMGQTWELDLARRSSHDDIAR